MFLLLHVLKIFFSQKESRAVTTESKHRLCLHSLFKQSRTCHSSILIVFKNFQHAIVTHMIFVLLHFGLEILLRKLNTTFQLWSDFMFSAPCIVIHLYNTNQQNARFSKVHPCTGTEALYRPYGP